MNELYNNNNNNNNSSVDLIIYTHTWLANVRRIQYTGRSIALYITQGIVRLFIRFFFFFSFYLKNVDLKCNSH